jgi:hypothetical protein
MTSANALVLGDARWKLARPICGTLRSQAVFYALAFFQLDGFAVPAPAQVSPTGTMAQTVSLPRISSQGSTFGV